LILEVSILSWRKGSVRLTYDPGRIPRLTYRGNEYGPLSP